MRNICMTVSYDGTGYSGFQSQPHGNTIQNKLEEAIAALTGEQVDVIGSGRTDAGVHARGQVINFLTKSTIPIGNWWRAINTRLPDDIVVLKAWEAPLEFHARRSAKRKTYRYTINAQRTADLFHRHYQLHHPRPLRIEEMQAAMKFFVGEHDFTSFCSRRSTKESHVRTVYEAYLEREAPWTGDGDILHIYLTSNGFLYNMVRIIAGTLIQIGEGKRSSEDIPAILAAKDRGKAGPTAMPHGLMLWGVEYAVDEKILDSSINLV